MPDLRIVAWITLTGVLAACVAASPAITPVPLGTWGGLGIELVVGEQSTRFELDCAHGEIVGRLEIPESGEADATGWMVLEGGPTLNAELFALGLVDEFFLTLGPVIVSSLREHVGVS